MFLRQTRAGRKRANGKKRRQSNIVKSVYTSKRSTKAAVLVTIILLSIVGSLVIRSLFTRDTKRPASRGHELKKPEEVAEKQNRVDKASVGVFPLYTTFWKAEYNEKPSIKTIVISYSSRGASSSLINVLHLPTVFYSGSNDEAWESALHLFIEAWNVKHIIIDGYTVDMKSMVAEFSAKNIYFDIIYHEYMGGRSAFASEIKSLSHFGKLRNVGLVNLEMIRDMEEYDVQMFFLHHLLPVQVLLSGPKLSAFDRRFHIGIAGSALDSFIPSTLSALCDVNALVHLFSPYSTPLSPSCKLIVIHHHIVDRVHYSKLLSQMDVNLYPPEEKLEPGGASESLSLGVPVPLSRHSYLFEGNPDLLRTLMCEDVEKPARLKACIQQLMREDLSALGERIRDLMVYINHARANQLCTFTDITPENLFVGRVMTGLHWSYRSTKHPVFVLPENLSKFLSKHRTSLSTEMDLSIRGMSTKPRGILFVVWDDKLFGKVELETALALHLSNRFKVSVLVHGVDALVTQLRTSYPSLRIFSVKDVLLEHHVKVYDPHTYMSQSYKIALAVELLLLELDLKMVEMVDYGGLGYQLLYRRNTRKSKSLSKLIIVSKLVGSRELSVPHMEATRPELQTHMMERYVFLTADVVLSPNPEFGQFYEKQLQVRPLYIVPCPYPAVSSLPPPSVRRVGTKNVLVFVNEFDFAHPSAILDELTPLVRSGKHSIRFHLVWNDSPPIKSFYPIQSLYVNVRNYTEELWKGYDAAVFTGVVRGLDRIPLSISLPIFLQDQPVLCNHFYGQEYSTFNLQKKGDLRGKMSQWIEKGWNAAHKVSTDVSLVKRYLWAVEDRGLSPNYKRRMEDYGNLQYRELAAEIGRTLGAQFAHLE